MMNLKFLIFVFLFAVFRWEMLNAIPLSSNCNVAIWNLSQSLSVSILRAYIRFQFAALLYILHFSPGNVSGGRVLPGLGGMGGMGDMSGMGGMESGNMAQGDGKTFDDPCYWIQDPASKLICEIKKIKQVACRLIPILPFCFLIG